ncbi:hypothetical protein VPHD528_0159 [Vibrio phage D528]
MRSNTLVSQVGLVYSETPIVLSWVSLPFLWVYG